MFYRKYHYESGWRGSQHRVTPLRHSSSLKSVILIDSNYQGWYNIEENVDNAACIRKSESATIKKGVALYCSQQSLHIVLTLHDNKKNIHDVVTIWNMGDRPAGGLYQHSHYFVICFFKVYLGVM